MTIQLTDSVKKAIDYIVESENFKTPPNVHVVQGSKAGDGYASKTYAISINGENGKRINLFVKYVPDNVEGVFKDKLLEAFRAEFRFYSEIYPTFCGLQEEKNLKEPFNNVPKHYSSNVKASEGTPIILENLRCLGYTLRDRLKSADEEHLKLPIIALARYHALSYAMKDQRPEVFKRLSTGIGDFLIDNFFEFKMDAIVINCVDQLLSSLDPVTDKRILDHCKNLSEIILEHVRSVPQNIDDYAVIGQGDCWSNNMMFLYDKETNSPIDVKLLDWQCLRYNSPLLDFSYFFYPLATKKILDNADCYLKLYYDTISQRIKELGSDPEKLYPYDVFLEHWRKFSLFGLNMAFQSVKVQLFDDDEIPVLLDAEDPLLEDFGKPIRRQDEYITRIRDLVEYFIDKDLL